MSSRLSPALLRRLAILLIVLALAMRVALPTGYMLAPGHSFTLMPCDGHMPMGAMPGMPGMAAADHAMPDRGEHAPKKHHDGSIPDHPCAFAAASASADTPVFALPALPPLQRNDAPLSRAGYAFPGRGLAAPPPLSTGPPFFA